MFQDVTHADLLFVLGIVIGGLIVGVGVLGWMVRDVHRITKAVGALVIQETGKLRRD